MSYCGQKMFNYFKYFQVRKIAQLSLSTTVTPEQVFYSGPARPHDDFETVDDLGECTETVECFEKKKPESDLKIGSCSSLLNISVFLDF